MEEKRPIEDRRVTVGEMRRRFANVPDDTLVAEQIADWEAEAERYQARCAELERRLARVEQALVPESHRPIFDPINEFDRLQEDLDAARAECEGLRAANEMLKDQVAKAKAALT